MNIQAITAEPMTKLRFELRRQSADHFRGMRAWIKNCSSMTCSWEDRTNTSLKLRFVSMTNSERCKYRYTRLRDAQVACEHLTWCDAVTKDNGINCLHTSASLCLLKTGVLASYGHTHASQQNLYMHDFAGKHVVSISKRKNQWPSPDLARWHSSALISWFTCEGNLNHFIGQTLLPVWYHSHASMAGAPALILVGESWPPHKENGCHSERFAWILSLMRIQPELYFATDGDATSYSTKNHTVVQLSSPHCFEHATVAASYGDASARFYQYIANQSGVCPKWRKKQKKDILFVQRNSTRHILNLQDAAGIVKLLPGVRRVRVVDFAQLAVDKQLKEACRADIMVGVQGQGLEWGHFLGNAADDGSTGVLEIHYPGWPCYYTATFVAKGTRSLCQEHARANTHMLAKSDNVRLNLDNFRDGMMNLLRQTYDSN